MLQTSERALQEDGIAQDEILEELDKTVFDVHAVVEVVQKQVNVEKMDDSQEQRYEIIDQEKRIFRCEGWLGRLDILMGNCRSQLGRLQDVASEKDLKHLAGMVQEMAQVVIALEKGTPSVNSQNSSDQHQILEEVMREVRAYVSTVDKKVISLE